MVIVEFGRVKALREVDQALVDIFSDKNTTILGFDVQGDLDIFRDYMPELAFYKRIANLVDV